MDPSQSVLPLVRRTLRGQRVCGRRRRRLDWARRLVYILGGDLLCALGYGLLGLRVQQGSYGSRLAGCLLPGCGSAPQVRRGPPESVALPAGIRRGKDAEEQKKQRNSRCSKQEERTALIAPSVALLHDPLFASGFIECLAKDLAPSGRIRNFRFLDYRHVDLSRWRGYTRFLLIFLCHSKPPPRHSLQIQ